MIHINFHKYLDLRSIFIGWLVSAWNLLLMICLCLFLFSSLWSTHWYHLLFLASYLLLHRSLHVVSALYYLQMWLLVFVDVWVYQIWTVDISAAPRCFLVAHPPQSDLCSILPPRKVHKIDYHKDMSPIFVRANSICIS